MTERNPTSDNAPSLFILTGQSNITGIRPSMGILGSAKSHGYSTLIDAAALASSARISLRNQPSADAMVVSFYKMFGYPTGVGALVAKKEFLGKLERRWFSGGTVDFVQAPGSLTLHAKDLTARFEVRISDGCRWMKLTPLHRREP
jgi:molybdenum cofactor sulfurtransferase